MRTLTLLVASACLAFGADDPWIKVKALKSGTELRIYKKGSVTPIQALAADATDDKLIVVIKKEQTAIDKSEIDRIDSRPSGTKKMTKTTTATSVDPTLQPVKGVRPEDYPSQSSSTSTSWSSNNVPFETIYRRETGRPVK
jgi:hypothetical protein